MTPAAALTNDLSRLGAAATAFLGARHRLLIGADWVDAADGGERAVLDPTSGTAIATVAEGGAADIDRAVRAARLAFDEGPWPRLRPNERERMILRLAELVEINGRELAEIESVNTGRALANTRAFDVDLSVDYLRYMAGWATKIHGQTLTPSAPYVPDRRFLAFTMREPAGVVGAITPWNVPLGQAVWKIAPVLATGCTMVLKPAEQTPLTALRFAELAAQVGLPPGVLNVVTGAGSTAGAALVEHPGVDKIAFTGSTEVGRSIGAVCGRLMKRCTLELGGKSPVVVLDDADLQQAIPGAAWAVFGNHGENCLAGSRLLVHRRVFDEVVQGVAEIAQGIRLGAPFGGDADMGPLISREQQRRVLGYIDSGRKAGGRLCAGGTAPEHSGFYVRPTVFADVARDAAVAREEIFGPVVVAWPFDDDEEAVRLANASEYGLGASVWTRDLQRAHRFIGRLDAGTVWVNAHSVLDVAVPFGGFKSSGLGRELGEEAIRHHTRLKSAYIPL